MTPKAGAHGELCGILCIKAALEARGEDRRVLLVPESAHGTNPATAAFAGFSVETIPATPEGRVDLAAMKSKLGPHVAGVMITNPNTCGLFEGEMKEISDAVHAAGGYVYCDGANFNAIVGRVRPGDLGIDAMHINLHKTFSTPHGGGGPGAGPVVLSAALAPFAPVPYVVADGGGLRLVEDGDADAGQSFGRMCAFHGQMGMFTRALTYILSHGADGLRQAAEDAVLNANYVLRSLEDVLDAPFGASGPCMHEALFSDAGPGGWFLDARHRQGPDRRGLPPDDGLFPAGGPRRHAGRADRDREQGRAGPVHRLACAAWRSGRGRATRRCTARRTSRRGGGWTRRWRQGSRCWCGKSQERPRRNPILPVFAKRKRGGGPLPKAVVEGYLVPVSFTPPSATAWLPPPHLHFVKMGRIDLTHPRPITSAARQASAMVGAFVLPAGIAGNTDVSHTRKPSTPRTLSSGSQHRSRIAPHPARAHRVQAGHAALVEEIEDIRIALPLRPGMHFASDQAARAAPAGQTGA